jgi:hypothetical protein
VLLSSKKKPAAMERSMAHFVHCVEVYKPRHSPVFWRIKTLSFFSLIQKGRTKS